MIAYRSTKPPIAPSRPTPPPPPATNATPWPSWYTSPPPPRPSFDLEQLKATVANDLGLHLDKLDQATRHRPYVMARMVIARILRERGWSYPQIAQAIKRDHATVITNDNKVETYARCYPSFRLVLEKSRRMYG